MPLTFANPEDYDKVKAGDKIVLHDVFSAVESGRMTMTVDGEEIELVCEYTERQIAILKAGGLLPYTKLAK